MPLCISLFLSQPDPDVLRNHQAYCALHGYPHRSFAPGRLGSQALRQAYKYQLLRHELASLVEGDWLLFLDDDSAVLHPERAEHLLEGRDAVVLEFPAAQGAAAPAAPAAMANMLLLRNTPANRQVLADVAAEVSRRMVVAGEPAIDEHAALRPLGILAANSPLRDVYPNVTWRMVNWYRAAVFTVHLAPLPTGEMGQVTLHDARLQNFLVRAITARMLGERNLLPPAQEPPPRDAYSVFQPQQKVALVSLYTHHIAGYASIAEENVLRYCRRHGLAYHVYRAIPAELDPATNGTWVKSWLLLRHFRQHEWVIWIDADILFVNQRLRLQDLLEGRDLLLAKDIGDWPANAGVLGFRCTEANLRLLEKLWARIEAVPDKTTVYSSMGDQYYVNKLLLEEGLAGEGSILTSLSVNTPSHLADDESLMVHFVGLGEPYRSAYMADVDARSQARG